MLLLDHEIEFISNFRADQYKEYYDTYVIRMKKSAKKRWIEEPKPDLKRIQQKLLPIFQQELPLHPAATAKRGSNIKENAIVHDNCTYLLQVDIKNCYHHVTWDTLYTSSAWANILLPSPYIKVCMFEGRLPTGAPTSPFLCNFALYYLDAKLTKLATQYGYKYTRYIDDLTFSTQEKTRRWELKDDVYEILHECFLPPNLEKTKWLTKNSNDNLTVTGVRIGTQEKVPRDFRRKVRAKLNNLAMNHQPIDPETRGCLAYIQSIDPHRHNALLEYYEERLYRASLIQTCANPE